MLIHSLQSCLPMCLSHGLMEPVGYAEHWNESGTCAEPAPNSLHFDNKPYLRKHASHPSIDALLLNGRSYRRGEAISPPLHSYTVSPTSPSFFPVSLPNSIYNSRRPPMSSSHSCICSLQLPYLSINVPTTQDIYTKTCQVDHLHKVTTCWCWPHIGRTGKVLCSLHIWPPP